MEGEAGSLTPLGFYENGMRRNPPPGAIGESVLFGHQVSPKIRRVREDIDGAPWVILYHGPQGQCSWGAHQWQVIDS